MARYPEAFDAGLIPTAYPDQAVSDVGAGPVLAVTAGIGGLLVTGLLLSQTLFTYGVANTHPSKMVRTTGYILAAVSALSTIVLLVGTPIVAVGAAGEPGA